MAGRRDNENNTANQDVGLQTERNVPQEPALSYLVTEIRDSINDIKHEMTRMRVLTDGIGRHLGDQYMEIRSLQWDVSSLRSFLKEWAIAAGIVSFLILRRIFHIPVPINA